MDSKSAGRNDAPIMARKHRKEFRTLYIGQWASRLQRKPSEIARAVGITESYLSLLISGDKKNPSATLLMDISEVLGISVNDLYRPPPTREVTGAVVQLRPDQLAVLGELLDTMKTRPGSQPRPPKK